MKKTYWMGVLIIACLLVPGSLLGQTNTKVAYPEDYRRWTRVKSMIIQEGHIHFKPFGVFHHIYANDKALTALKKAKSFSKGSILVFELFQAITENNAITEGRRLVIGVMEKDPDRFQDTEGWGFEDFEMGNPH